MTEWKHIGDVPEEGITVEFNLADLRDLFDNFDKLWLQVVK